MMREDAQPNETRIGRKGAPAIPMIRCSRTRQPIHQQQTGNKRAGSYHHPYALSQAASSRHRYGPLAASSSSMSGPSGQPALQDRKQLTYQEPNHRPWNHLLAIGTSRGSHGSRYDTMKRVNEMPTLTRKAAAQLDSTVLKLPDYCQKGAPNRKATRQRWLREQIAQLEANLLVTVISHAFISENAVRLEHRANQDKKPSVSVDSLPAGNGSSDPHMSILAPAVFADSTDRAQRSPGGLTRVGSRQSHYRGADVSTSEVSPIAQTKPIGGGKQKAEQRTSCPDTFIPEVLPEFPSVAPDVHPKREELDCVQELLLRFQNALEDRKEDSSACGNDAIVSKVENVYSGPETAHARTRVTVPAHVAESIDVKPLPPQGPPRFGDTTPELRSEVHLSNTSTAPFLTPHTCVSAQSGPREMTTASEPPPTDQVVQPQAAQNSSVSNSCSSAVESVSECRTAQTSRARPVMSEAEQYADEGRELAPDHTLPRLVPVDEPHQIARIQYDKPRSLLSGSSQGALSITVRGSVNYWTRQGRSWQPRVLLTASREQNTLLDDACLVSSTAGEQYLVLAHVRDSRPLSLVLLGGEQVGIPYAFDRPTTAGVQHGGISAVSPLMQDGLLATGGYDHRVHLWTIPHDAARTSTQLLSVKHTSLVQSLLAIRDTSHKLVTAGADCTANLYDISSERVVRMLKASNSVYKLHRLSSPFCTLWEVAHRDLQFEIRDHRRVPTDPVQRFGYETSRLHGRYVKGKLIDSTFLSGDWDGSVRLWDMRKLGEPYQTLSCIPGRRILQVCLIPGVKQVMVCSEDYQIRFLDYV